MPKRIKHESFKYAFLLECQNRIHINSKDELFLWKDFVAGINFMYSDNSIKIIWDKPSPSSLTFSLKGACFYKRKINKGNNELSIKRKNQIYFRSVVNKVALKTDFIDIYSTDKTKEIEIEFHNEWSKSEKPNNIDVIKNNEVCTAPEMKFIVKKLGALDGKTLLDIGCGLGESSVYFAIKGAEVTSSDLSNGMLKFTKLLANINKTNVRTHLADAEDIKLKSSEKFDIIYAGNLLHHIEIQKFIENIILHLKPGGVFVSWDPIAYNPIINIYRFIASEVRTPDEHPLTYKDIKIFDKYFDKVEKKYFWFFTLIIFLIMAVIQRRNPNRERYWKIILEEGDKWKWIYKPLEILDKLILFLIPPLKLLCWNIVIIAHKRTN